MKIFKLMGALMMGLVVGALSAADSAYWRDEAAQPENFVSYPKAKRAAERKAAAERQAAMDQEAMNAEGRVGRETQERNRRATENAELLRQEDIYNRSWSGKIAAAKSSVRGAGSYVKEKTSAGLARVGEGTINAYEGAKRYSTSAGNFASDKFQLVKQECSDFCSRDWAGKREYMAANPGTTALVGTAALGVVGLTVYAAYRAATGLYNWFKAPRQLPVSPVNRSATNVRALRGRETAKDINNSQEAINPKTK